MMILQAMGLSGQKLLGVPIVIQPSQAEKNRVGMSYSDPMIRPEKGPMKLYIGSLHFNITEDMLRSKNILNFIQNTFISFLKMCNVHQDEILSMILIHNYYFRYF